MSQITSPQFIKENYDSKIMSLKAETYRMSSPSKECVRVCMCVFGGGDLLPQRTSCLGDPGPR